ncbi:protein kinase domain protein [Ichthyophthirius multifiliis]|uniref:Protein kinase domain protein n=1 Tax=Ichthyophthirius multifiliis TaxID=5932 RepID=G0QUM5_ICHMU|nr:protein kinase domain protein [Ichthyophthirius multifiliis]EGR31071.1 protein kinase domain protein [Ichthyophthirius multifiliis]|eukprot:XP_004034557.1 protein kinase domain protein [Ichthyophthirius multifiliis]
MDEFNNVKKINKKIQNEQSRNKTYFQYQGTNEQKHNRFLSLDFNNLITQQNQNQFQFEEIAFSQNDNIIEKQIIVDFSNINQVVKKDSFNYINAQQDGKQLIINEPLYAANSEVQKIIDQVKENQNQKKAGQYFHQIQSLQNSKEKPIPNLDFKGDNNTFLQKEFNAYSNSHIKTSSVDFGNLLKNNNQGVQEKQLPLSYNSSKLISNQQEIKNENTVQDISIIKLSKRVTNSPDLNDRNFGIQKILQNYNQHNIKTNIKQFDNLEFQKNQNSQTKIQKFKSKNQYENDSIKYINLKINNSLKNINNISLNKQNQLIIQDSIDIYRNQNKEQFDINIFQYNQQPRNYNNRFFFLDQFAIGKKLGSGKFSDIYLAMDNKTGLKVALKQIKKSKIIQYKMVQDICNEIKALTVLDHPGIIKLYGFFYEKDAFYIVQELACGNELFQDMKQQYDKKYNEQQTANYIHQLIQILQYIHSRNIVHRDIKPENIMISNGIIKLCDFGCSGTVKNNQLRQTFCGTADYISPEMVQRKQYDFSVDIWSLGILTYELIFGKAPFTAFNNDATFNKVLKVLLIFFQIQFKNQGKCQISRTYFVRRSRFYQPNFNQRSQQKNKFRQSLWTSFYIKQFKKKPKLVKLNQ